MLNIKNLEATIENKHILKGLNLNLFVIQFSYILRVIKLFYCKPQYFIN